MTSLHRLYIGGLPPGTAAHEVSNRFKPFGDVKQTELITDSETGGSRGFAYVNIDCTEASLQKCLTVYGKSKWKGSTVLVQKAKPTYLDRLKAEWTAPPLDPRDIKAKRLLRKSSNTKDKVKKKTIRIRKVKPAPTAPLPDEVLKTKKGWAVLRNDRPVAIMKMRRRPGAKVMTINPSKLKDSLKRIRINSKDERKCSELEWFLEDGDTPRYRAAQQTVYTENDDSDNENTGNQNINVSEQQETELQEEEVEEMEEDDQEDSDVDNQSDENVEDETVPSSNVRQYVSDDDEEEGDDDSEYHDANDDEAEEEQTSQYYDAEQSQPNDADEEEREEDEKDDDDGDDSDDLPEQADVPDDDPSDNEDEDTKTPPAQEEEEEEESEEEEEDDDNEDGQTKPPLVAAKKTAAPKSQLSANDRRLLALKEQQALAEERRLATQKALTGGTSSKKIVFDSASDLDESEKSDVDDAKSLPQAQKVTNWMGSDTDEDAEDNLNIEVKKIFEGKNGATMMKLQRSFGADQRFRMDDRFADDDENDEAESGYEAPMQMEQQRDDNVNDEDVGAERNRAMDILKSVVPGMATSSVAIAEAASKRARNTFKPPIQYDPSKKDEADTLELKPNSVGRKRTVEEEDEEALASRKQKTTKPQTVDDTRFVNMQQNLQDLFTPGRHPENVSEFKLFGDVFEPVPEQATEAGAALTLAPLQDKSSRRVIRPVDSTDLEIKHYAAVESHTEAKKKNSKASKDATSTIATKEKETLFFFHLSDDTLRNRIDLKKGSDFVRPATSDEAEEFWKSQRSKLTMDFKRKHKDSLRRRAKLSSSKRVVRR